MFLSNQLYLEKKLSIVLNSFEHICNSFIEINNLNSKSLKNSLVFLSNDLTHELNDLIKEIDAMPIREYSKAQQESFIKQLLVKITNLLQEDSTFLKFKENLEQGVDSANDFAAQLQEVKKFLKDYLDDKLKEAAIKDIDKRLVQIKKQQEQLFNLADQENAVFNEKLKEGLDELARKICKENYLKLSENDRLSTDDISRLKRCLSELNLDEESIKKLHEEKQQFLIKKHLDPEYAEVQEAELQIKESIRKKERNIEDLKQKLIELQKSPGKAMHVKAVKLEEQILEEMEKLKEDYSGIRDVNTYKTETLQDKYRHDVLSFSRQLLLDFYTRRIELLIATLNDQSKLVKLSKKQLIVTFNKLQFLVEKLKQLDNVLEEEAPRLLASVRETATFFSLSDQYQNQENITRVLQSGVLGQRPSTAMVDLSKAQTAVVVHSASQFLEKAFLVKILDIPEESLAEVPVQIDEVDVSSIHNAIIDEESLQLKAVAQQFTEDLQKCTFEREAEKLKQKLYSGQLSIIPSLTNQGAIQKAKIGQVEDAQGLLQHLGDLTEHAIQEIRSMDQLINKIVHFLSDTKNNEAKDTDELNDIRTKLYTLSNDLSHALQGGTLNYPERRLFF